MSQGSPPLRRSGQGPPPLPPGPPSRAVKCIRGDEIALWGTAPRRTFGPHVYIWEGVPPRLPLARKVAGVD